MHSDHPVSLAADLVVADCTREVSQGCPKAVSTPRSATLVITRYIWIAINRIMALTCSHIPPCSCHTAVLASNPAVASSRPFGDQLQLRIVLHMHDQFNQSCTYRHALYRSMHAAAYMSDLHTLAHPRARVCGAPLYSRTLHAPPPRWHCTPMSLCQASCTIYEQFCPHCSLLKDRLQRAQRSEHTC